MNLMDLMQGGQGPRYRYASVAPGYDGGSTVPAQSGLDPQIEAAIAAASQPEPTVDLAVPKQSKLWQRIMSAIADAGSAYGAGMGAGRPTNFTGDLIARDEYGQKVMAHNQQARADSQRKGSKAAAELRLRALLDKQNRSAALADRELARTEEAAWRKEQLKQAKEIADRGQAQDLALFNAKKEWDVKLQNAGFAHDQAIAGIRKKGVEGDELAKEDRKSLGPLFSTIGTLAMTAKKNIAEGKTTPEELMALIETEVDAATLSTPEAKAAIETYILKKMGPVLRDVEAEKMNQELAAGSPDVRDGGGPGVLQRMGSVRTPQRY